MSKPYNILIFLLAAGGALLFAAPARAAGGEQAENSCVRCHIALPGSSFVGVRSHDWSGSVHEKRGVTCDRCHGGNPGASDRKDAHAGVLGSSDPKSSVYFKNVPATCGKCHGAELYEFTRSKHYRMLESEGRGPACVACHGSMVVAVLSPENVAAVCERCHNERMGIFPCVPQKARAVLLLLRESVALADANEKLHHPAEGSPGAAHLKDARSDLHSARLDWHRFDLDAITGRLHEAFNSLEKLSGESPRQ